MASREEQHQTVPSDGDAGEDIGRVVRAYGAQQQVRNEILQMKSQEDWRRVVFRLWQELSEWVRFDACGINLIDAQTREWIYYAVDDEGKVEVNHPGELAPAIVHAMETGKPAYRTDRADPLMADMAPEVQSVIDVPFRGGTLALNSTVPKAWTVDQIALLDQFAGVMAEGCLRLADLKILEDQGDELRRHRDHLEVMVQERTQELEAAMDKVQRQTEQIMELSTPILQIRAGIAVAPLIGNLDGDRTQRLMEVLLQHIVSTRSSTALIDITGVPAIDTATAQNLIEAVTAVRLLGARVVLTGVRPVIAQTLVQLGIDLHEIETFATLADGLRQMPLSSQDSSAGGSLK